MNGGDLTFERYWFNEWLFGMGSLSECKGDKKIRDEALAGWLNKLGGLAGVW